jgi:hypothetical protein
MLRGGVYLILPDLTALISMFAFPSTAIVTRNRQTSVCDRMPRTLCSQTLRNSKNESDTLRSEI